MVRQLGATDNSHLSVELTNNKSMDSIILPSSISPCLNGYLVKQSERTMMESRKWHCWLRVNLVATGMTPRSFSAKLLWSWVSPRQCWCLELFLPRCRTLLFPLLHEVHVSSFLQPLQVPLDGSTTLWRISHLCLFVVSKLAVGALCPIAQVDPLQSQLSDNRLGGLRSFQHTQRTLFQQRHCFLKAW